MCHPHKWRAGFSAKMGPILNKRVPLVIFILFPKEPSIAPRWVPPFDRPRRWSLWDFFREGKMSASVAKKAIRNESESEKRRLQIMGQVGS